MHLLCKTAEACLTDGMLTMDKINQFPKTSVFHILAGTLRYFNSSASAISRRSPEPSRLCSLTARVQTFLRQWKLSTRSSRTWASVYLLWSVGQPHSNACLLARAARTPPNVGQVGPPTTGLRGAEGRSRLCCHHSASSHLESRRTKCKMVPVSRMWLA